MTTILDPLKRHLQNKLYAPARNAQEATDHLVDVVKKSGVPLDEVKEALQEQKKAQFRLDSALAEYFLVHQAIQGTAQEVGAQPNIADKIADSVTIANLIDGLAGLDYIKIARDLEAATIETVEHALVELASYENGNLLLVKIEEALKKVKKN